MTASNNGKDSNWRIGAAITIFFSSYFPLSIVLLIQDINSASFRQLSTEQVGRFFKLLGPDPSGAFGGALKVFWGLFNNPEVSLPIAAITGISIVILKLLMSKIKGGEVIEVKKSIKNPSDLMNYTLPYMVAFIGVDLGNGPKVGGFILFMLFMFILSYRSKQLFMNPILAVLGYSLYDVDYSINNCDRSARILSKTNPTPGDSFRLKELASLPIITQKEEFGGEQK